MKKKTIIISSIVVAVILVVIGAIIITTKPKSELTATEVQNTVLQKVNNHDIYIEDVGKIKNIKNVKYIETIDNIEYWKMDCEYELSSLNAPMGKNYSGTSLNATFGYAYDLEKKKSYEYMFEIGEYERLKGWSKNNREKIDSWK